MAEKDIISITDEKGLKRSVCSHMLASDLYNVSSMCMDRIFTAISFLESDLEYVPGMLRIEAQKRSNSSVGLSIFGIELQIRRFRGNI